MENQELTFGQKAVGITFNPSNDPSVQKVKELYTEIIDFLNEARGNAGIGGKASLLSDAIKEAQGAQMWAVKGLTWNE